MADICRGCGLDIVPLVDARYTGREPEETWHYACWSKDRPAPTNMRTLAAQMATASANVERAFEDLKRGLERAEPRSRPKHSKVFAQYKEDEF